MNQKNSLGLNSCFMDLDDPLELFKIWMTEAEKKDIRDKESRTTHGAGHKSPGQTTYRGG